ncbi:lipopolysaccharide biosynthesis protein [Tolypothrix campylonemoides VB511288]|nr:lipopolysaccharide biosynthesis protein [Tolypothrix campylonemoides VB511288]
MEQIKPLTLRRNFSWTFIGNAVYAACQWGMVMAIAKLGNPEMVGQFTLGFAITAPVLLFTNLQLRGVQATDARKEYVFADYLGLRLIGICLALLIILGITLAAGYGRETSRVILIIGLAKALESISDVFYGLMQQYERMDRIAVSMMIKGPLSLLLLGLGVYLTRSIFWGAVGLAVAWAIVLFVYDIRNGILMLNKVAIRPHWHWEKLGKLTWLALPLGFVMMLTSLDTNIPRYLIEQYLGQRELGIFAAIAHFMLIGGMVVNALGDSATPRLAKYYATGNSIAFRTLILKLTGIGALLGSVAIVVSLAAGKQLLTLLYRPEYAEQANVLVWLMVGAAIVYTGSFLSYGITAARYFRIQMPLYSLVIGTTVISCIWFIPSMGLLGAAIALIIGALVRVICTLAVVCHAWSVLQRKWKAAQVQGFSD